MPDSLSLEATIEGVEYDQGSGWYTALTDQGKFSTKIREIAEGAAALRGRRALITYTENVVTKPAPDGSGMRTYRNRYLSRAGELPAFGGFGGMDGITQIGGQQQPQPQPEITPARGEDPRRAWRIALQNGAHVAVATLPLMPNEQRSFDVQKQIALAWAKFTFFTPVPQEIAGTAVMPNPLPSPQEAYGDVPDHRGAYYEPVGAGVASHEQPPPHGDDDIPF